MKSNQKEEALKWLAQAEEELKDAAHLKEKGRYYLSLFLCQQSAEKALKAFLYYKEKEPVMTHSVSALLKMVRQIDQEFNTISHAKRLDDYYIPTRYPNGVPDDVPAKYYDDPDEADEALNLASKVIKLVSSKII